VHEKTLQGVQTLESFKGSEEGEISGRVALCTRSETQVEELTEGTGKGRGLGGIQILPNAERKHTGSSGELSSRQIG
jgi:hypothetical protein